MSRSKRIKIVLFFVYIAISLFVLKVLYVGAAGFASGKQFVYLPWVECDFVTPKFGCFWSK